MKKPCNYQTDAGWCPVLRIGHPTGEICRSCPHYTGKQLPVGNAPGLGDRIERGIDILTLGQGKKIAKKVAQARGKADCGCAKRREQLNGLGKRLTGKPLGDTVGGVSRAKDGGDKQN
tara:strand:- start:597 stop:950 length:354 start_codon:yes stop_codon:yes gene_type:complete